MCSKLPAIFTLFPVLSLWVHVQLRSFYLRSTFDGAHARKNTRLCLPAQLQCSCSGAEEPGSEGRYGHVTVEEPGNEAGLYSVSITNLRKQLKALTALTNVLHTSLPKREVGGLLSVSTFNHKRASMSCVQRLNALEANNWTNNNAQQGHQQLQSRVLTAPCHCEDGVAHCACRISYVQQYARLPCNKLFVKY